MRSQTFVFLLLALTLGAMSAHGLEAGAAVRTITPEKLLPISGGTGAPVMPEKKQGDLFVRALVLADGDVRVAIVSIDCLGFPGVLADRVRSLVEGVPAENILIGATHTHSAPDFYAFPDGQGGHGGDLAYIDWVIGEMAAAINEAANNLVSAHVKINVGEAKGKIAYNYYAPDLYDPRCGVIQAVESDSGKIIATLVNYASHPEVLGTGRKTLSPDFCGPLYDRIEEATGGVAIYMNGAQGGMVTADCRGDDGKDVQTWDECVRIGTLLADEALRIVQDAPVQRDPALYCAAETLRLPVSNPMMTQILEGSGLDYSSVTDGKSVTTQMNLVNLGTAQLVTIPGEALPNIGYYLKRKMPAEHDFLLGLTNDAFGYILSREDFDSFRRYDYITRTSLGEETGPVLVDFILDLVSRHPSPARP